MHQKLQCIQGEDGKIQFKGLLPGNIHIGQLRTSICYLIYIVVLSMI